MKRPLVLSLAFACLLVAGTATWADDHGSAHSRSGMDHGLPPPVLLMWDTMYGVDGPFVGDANAIRGVVGDEAPWTVAHFIKGRLTADGKLFILVRGLVFADDPSVDPSLVGKNDETDFRGLVSCLTENADGTLGTVNVTTDPFPADTAGNSFIRTQISLPNPCVAPIVFVLAGSEDKWFAVTGAGD